MGTNLIANIIIASCMHVIFATFTLTITSEELKAQSFLNGSFENTSSPASCNYNMTNLTYNSLMPNSTAFGNYEYIDIQVAGCYVPTIADGIYAVSLANEAANIFNGEAISLELSTPLVAGFGYTMSFQAYAMPDFGTSLGNMIIGASTSPTSFGVMVYTATPVFNTWTSYTFTFTAPNNAAHIAVMPEPGTFAWNSIDDFSISLSCSITTGTDVQTYCDSYTWIDGNTYTVNNNSAKDTLTNVAGCDSIVTLNLTINNSNTGTYSQTACGSYTWIDGYTYTTSDSTATHTLTNAAGCDSVVTLNLTINNSNTGTDIQTSCGSYTWIDGYTYTTSDSTATHTLTNAAGCDSVVSLDLTINTVDNGITNSSPTLTANATSGTYQWLDCDNNYSPIAGETNQSFTATSNGNYAVEVTQNNCIDTSDCESGTVVSLQEIKKSELLLYPNPTSGILTIEGAEGIVTVYDIYGRLVLTTKTNTLDISQATMGIYFVRVLDEEGKVYSQKVVKD